MKLKIELIGLKDYQKNYLYADLAYFKASIQKNLIEEIEKYRQDRNFLLKLFKIASRWNLASNNFEYIQQTMDALSKVEYVKYSIEETGNKTILYLEVSDLLFELQNYVGLLKHAFGLNKQQFVQKLVKEINEEYRTKPIIQELS